MERVQRSERELAQARPSLEAAAQEASAKVGCSAVFVVNGRPRRCVVLMDHHFEEYQCFVAPCTQSMHDSTARLNEGLLGNVRRLF
jgi:hypothetical protein